MLENLFFYFRLAWFCLRLLLNLLLFTLTFLVQKINQKKAWQIMLIILICSIWLCNFFLIKQRSTPQINLKKINSGPNWEKSVWQTQPQPQMVILTEAGLQEKLDYYKVLADKKINSLGLWLNLQQLYEATGQSDLAREYFNKAQQIEPQLKL
jgi:tetratricopeptide (TPR) repeat protein